jgi:hypothetical protein
MAEVHGNRTHLGQPSLPHTGFEVRQNMGVNSRIFLLFSVIKEGYLIRHCTSGYLEMTLKYLPEEAVYSLYTPLDFVKCLVPAKFEC